MLSISLTGATGAIFLLSTIQIAVAAPLYNADIVSNPLQGGYKNVAYYCDWRAASFQPHQMPVDKLTHVLHSFAVPQDDGTIVLENNYANFEMAMGERIGQVFKNPNETWGVIEQLYLLKKDHRNLKTLLSIGGISNSLHFPNFAMDPKGRSRFVSNAISMMKDFGMDGIDIDWEYPSTIEEGQAFVLVLKELREAMDIYSSRSAKGYHFEITAAVGASIYGYGHLDFPGMDKYLDSWHLMTYDFKGGWEVGSARMSGHNANLYRGKSGATWSVEESVNAYLSHGIPSPKLILGFPLYGLQATETDGLGMPYQTSSADTYAYKELPRPGAQVFWDADAMASYTYDAGSREFMSYDDPRSIAVKTNYLKDKNLGGAMWWEISNDKEGSESLVNTVADTLGGKWNLKQNMLCYPESKFVNVRGSGC